MMPKKIWNFWAPRYERLWAQHFALKPARDMIIAHLDKNVPGATRILDIGCGVGQLAHELAICRPQATIVGADSSVSMIESARMRHAAKNIEYHVGTIDQLGRSGLYDVIVTTHAFPYFPEKLASLRTMLKLLAPGGRLLIVNATIENFYDLLFMIFVRLTVSSAQYLSARQIASFLNRAGFILGGIHPMPRAKLIPSIYMLEGIRPEKEVT